MKNHPICFLIMTIEQLQQLLLFQSFSQMMPLSKQRKIKSYRLTWTQLKDSTSFYWIEVGQCKARELKMPKDHSKYS